MSTLTQEWTEKLAAWRSSGLSIAAWCRQSGEGYHRFLYWRRRLEASQPAPSGRFPKFDTLQNANGLISITYM
jgi:hypothetical protein